MEADSDQVRKLLGADQDDHQLELFPERNPAREVLLSLWEHRDKIRQMHEIMEKVLAGEPGYARDPRRTPKRSKSRIPKEGGTVDR